MRSRRLDLLEVSPPLVDAELQQLDAEIVAASAPPWVTDWRSRIASAPWASPRVTFSAASTFSASALPGSISSAASSFADCADGVVQLQQDRRPGGQHAGIACIHIAGRIDDFEGLVQRVAEQKEPRELEFGVDVLGIELGGRA